MSLLKALFGPSKEEIWQQLSQETGARYVDGGFWGAKAVQAQHGDWIVTLDTYTVSTGKSSTTYTRLRAPFINRDGFRFTVYRAGLFTELGKLLGMQDVEIGEPTFDRQFVIKGNDEGKLRQLFGNARFRELLTAQPAIWLNVQDDEGWFGARFPEGVDELWFQVMGIITDLNVLRSLFDLYAVALDQLCHMDSAYEDDLALHVQALLSPGGRISTGELLLWDGGPPRRRAVQALGAMKDARALPALCRVLEDPDSVIRESAVWALGEIGDPRAAPALIPLLSGGGPECAVANTLRSLGLQELVNAYYEAMGGSETAAERLKGGYRDAFVQALRRVVGTSDLPRRAAHAARALAGLGAIETLGDVRSAIRRHGRADEEAREILSEAVSRLETHAALPRPADAAPARDDASLPRPGAAPELQS